MSYDARWAVVGVIGIYPSVMRLSADSTAINVRSSSWAGDTSKVNNGGARHRARGLRSVLPGNTT